MSGQGTLTEHELLRNDLVSAEMRPAMKFYRFSK